jgi:hypothetical protein
VENLTIEELKELALGLNLISANRNAFHEDDTIDKYKETNEKYLEMDKNLLIKIKNEINKIKIMKEND